MIIVLDSNEYINFLHKKVQLEKVFEIENVLIHINELIVKESLRNVSEPLKKEFYALLLRSNIVLRKEKLPERLFTKYRQKGLKKGDIVVASFCENEKADCLVSENRHFLKDAKFDRFRVVKLSEFLAAFGKHSEA